MYNANCLISSEGKSKVGTYYIVNFIVVRNDRYCFYGNNNVFENDQKLKNYKITYLYCIENKFFESTYLAQKIRKTNRYVLPTET